MSPDLPTTPLGRPDIVRLFGNPMLHLMEDGNVSRSWEQAILEYAILPAPLPLAWDRNTYVRRFRCHRLLVRRFESAFNRIHRSPEAWGTIGDFGGCYLFRPQRGTKSILSTHCWGISVDIDVLDNPMGSSGRVHPTVIAAFEEEGFLWGGRFSGKRRDPMHMEFADPAKLTRS